VSNYKFLSLAEANIRLRGCKSRDEFERRRTNEP